MKKIGKFKFRHLLLILLVFLISKTLISQRSMMSALNAKKQLEEEKIAVLEDSIEKLNFEIEDKDSLEFIEKVARQDFNMVRAKEIIYIDKNKTNNRFIKTKKE